MSNNIDFKAAAIKEYSNADSKTKQSLKNIFGEDFFTSVIDRIKTWEDAAKEYGIDPKDLPYRNPKNSREEYINAAFQLDIIAEVLSEEVVLDWTDSDQRKWYPWFNNYKPGSGFRFFDSNYDWTHTGTFGGARLCVPTKELSDYFGTQFLDIWNKFLNPIKK